ncbi:hypothetical protein C8F04DRAFT_1278460 [Mycena alexandri]|uniref:Uncharacterized protein n=1 Tax=Mycena alexandri TaxID=1745969 RepID=A0AAD6S014_9AGAR|nr:hypothetical protein C8F04DRAFT_1278460 [Mycena alexandri]
MTTTRTPPLPPDAEWKDQKALWREHSNPSGNTRISGPASIPSACSILRPAVALSFQAKERRDKVYNKMTADYHMARSVPRITGPCRCVCKENFTTPPRAPLKSPARKTIQLIADAAPSRSKTPGKKGGEKKLASTTP